jgi:hypothetical protein
MTWSERVAHIARAQKGDYFTRHIPSVVAQRLGEHVRGSWGAADQLGHIAAKLLFTHGPALVREVFAPIRHVIPQAVAAYFAETDLKAGDLAMTILDMADATNAFESIGFDVPPSVLESFRPYLPAVREFREYPAWSWRKGFIALALNERRVWAPIAGYLPEQPIRFKPGKKFALHVQGLLAHLGAARLVGARFEDVVPAWSSFLTYADTLFDMREIEYELVPWIARIVYHHIGQWPLDRVGELLHAQIQRCIAADV